MTQIRVRALTIVWAAGGLALSGIVTIAASRPLAENTLAQSAIQASDGEHDPAVGAAERPALCGVSGSFPLGAGDPVAGVDRSATHKLLGEQEIMQGFADGAARVPVIVNLTLPAAAPAMVDWNDQASAGAVRDVIRAHQDSVLSRLPGDEYALRHRFENQAGFSADVSRAALDALINDPDVDTIEPVRMLQPALAQGIALMNGMVYRSTYNGAGVAIAICDTGIDYNHPRLGGGGFPNTKVIGGYDFGDSDANPFPNGLDGKGHGTCCAGIAAGDLGTVGDYIGGVAYNAKLYALKITPAASDSAWDDAMIAAWNWCVTHKNDDPGNPILVISTSFGGGQHATECDTYSPAMTTAANNAVVSGITVLASSANNGYCDSTAWPACISSVVSVGAVYDANIGSRTWCINGDSCAPGKTPNPGCTTGYSASEATAADQVTVYSNSASFLTLLAPSNDAYTTDMVGSAGYSAGDYCPDFGGTSAACPYAAGAAAAVQSAAKARTGSFVSATRVRTGLTSTGRLVTDAKSGTWTPRVNLSAAIDAASSNMVLVPGGSFEMGDTFHEGNSDEQPHHTVYISPFYIDKYEVTNQQYADALNWANGQGLITVGANHVVYKPGSGTSYPYCNTSVVPHIYSNL